MNWGLSTQYWPDGVIKQTVKAPIPTLREWSITTRHEKSTIEGPKPELHELEELRYLLGVPLLRDLLSQTIVTPMITEWNEICKKIDDGKADATHSVLKRVREYHSWMRPRSADTFSSSALPPGGPPVHDSVRPVETSTFPAADQLSTDNTKDDANGGEGAKQTATEPTASAWPAVRPAAADLSKAIGNDQNRSAAAAPTAFVTAAAPPAAAALPFTSKCISHPGGAAVPVGPPPPYDDGRGLAADGQPEIPETGTPPASASVHLGGARVVGDVIPVASNRAQVDGGGGSVNGSVITVAGDMTKEMAELIAALRLR